MKIGAIILAAGHSRRMGKQKLLLPMGGRTLIDQVVEEVLASAVDHVVVVVSQDEEKVQKELSKHRVAAGGESRSRGRDAQLRAMRTCKLCPRVARRRWWCWGISRE